MAQCEILGQSNPLRATDNIQDIELDLNNLENYFSLEERPRIAQVVEEGNEQVEKEKKVLIKLLDNKRSDAIGTLASSSAADWSPEIMLKGLKMENADVLNTLIELDTEISAEKISAICKNMPTTEEVCSFTRRQLTR